MRNKIDFNISPVFRCFKWLIKHFLNRLNLEIIDNCEVARDMGVMALRRV